MSCTLRFLTLRANGHKSYWALITRPNYNAPAHKFNSSANLRGPIMHCSSLSNFKTTKCATSKISRKAYFGKRWPWISVFWPARAQKVLFLSFKSKCLHRHKIRPFRFLIKENNNLAIGQDFQFLFHRRDRHRCWLMPTDRQNTSTIYEIGVAKWKDNVIICAH